MEAVTRSSRRRPSLPTADHVNNNHIKQVSTSSVNLNRPSTTSSGNRLHHATPQSPSQQLMQHQIHQQQLLYHHQQQLHHREKAETQAMFIDSKKNMLEIIEEGLQLKLEIKSIKEQFLSLLHNYDKQQPEGAMPAKGVSAARARVKALYEARKQRLLARRSVGKDDEQKENALPKAKRRRESNKENKENKENNPMPPSGYSSKSCTKSRQQSSKITSSTPFAKPQITSCKKNGKLLTPIKEEYNIPIRRTKNTISAASLSDLEGDYVTLRAPNNYENLATLTTPRRRSVAQCSGLALDQDTSIWVNSSDGLSQAKDMTVELSSLNYTGSPSRLTQTPPRDSRVKYASSNFISELYTSPTNTKNIKDVSHITKINSTLREQVSGTNLNGSIFHSTLNYPLHSTLNYPLNSTGFPEDLAPPQSTPSDHGLSDSRTTISEPSHVLLSQDRQTKQSAPQAFDDSWLDIKSLVKVEKKMSRSKRSSSSSSRSRSTSRSTTRSLSQTPKSQRIARPSLESPRTPSAQPVLCKEHGLHPNFGGPCIFQTDDSVTMSESSEEDQRPRARRSSVAGYTETDCDSSYLSECMDEGSNFNQGLSEAEEYTATYDARYGRMKMLKRQTGQIGLDTAEEFRPHIGLSDSDFLEATMFLDATKKHLSLEATRSSLPDLSNLETSEDDPDSTLKTTQLDIELGEQEVKVTPKAEVKLERTMTNASDQRPPSTLTSTSTTTSTTSPDSNSTSTQSGGLRVPVNSPNGTDSGSSSKPTTDNYDYVEVPLSKENVRLPPARYPHPPRPSTRKRPGSARSAYTSISRHRDQQSPRRCLRYNAHHDGDSGFSTPGSLRQRNQQSENGHVLINDDSGQQRAIVQHSAVARNLQRERKKQIVKKLKQFNNTVYSTGNLNIQTLGHF